MNQMREPEFKMSKDKSVSRLHTGDVREFMKVLKGYGSYKKFVDLTITSPPYYNVKSYGYKNQIGHGQKYEDYLDDLDRIFEQIYHVTKDTGSLWIIVDSFSRGGRLVQLPFEIAERIRNSGWFLVDTHIWRKDKSLPWTNKGHLRNVFEYILFFAKTDSYKFYDNRIRIFELPELKEWWVKYPERYNPEGKLPTNVWEYPVPTQGSWGHRNMRHFNPLPPKMIERILLLTTDKGDVVLDPFAGSGTVLAVADFWGRRWFGFEKNQEYCDMFKKYVLKEIEEELANEQKRNEQFRVLRKKFRRTIEDLRLVKFPKSLVKEIYRRDILGSKQISLNTIFALFRKPAKDEISTMPSNKFMIEDIFLIFDEVIDSEDLAEQIRKIGSKAPLSKFGIEPNIVVMDRNEFVSRHENMLQGVSFMLYAYGVVHKFEKQTTFSKWRAHSENPKWKNYFRNGVPPIISNVKVNRRIPKIWKSREERFRILISEFEEEIGQSD